MAAGGENRWPYLGRNRWPLTSVTALCMQVVLVMIVPAVNRSGFRAAEIVRSSSIVAVFGSKISSSSTP